jgi:N-acetyl-anhydromuramyl-L-alanine amidase AmpD
MWYKLIQASNNDLWIVGFDGSNPKEKILLARWNGNVNLEVLKLVNGAPDFSRTYIDDLALMAIPTKGTQTSTESNVNPNPIVAKPKVDIVRLSPHRNSRNGTRIDMLVIHNTLGAFDGAVSWLTDPNRVRDRTSAHYVIARDGRLAQLVPDNENAWHAGARNRRSIGIELESTRAVPGLTPIQIDKLNELCRYLMQEYKITKGNVVPHGAIPNNDCPGVAFPAGTFFAWRGKL